MVKVLLGRKLGMTQIFLDNELVPVTVIEAGPSVVTGVKVSSVDGYTSVQLGFGEKRKIKKPVFGQVHKLGKFQVIKEFRLPHDEAIGEYTVGKVVSVDVFQPGDLVNVTGVTKGKGFQGVVKRHGFRDAPRTHGQSTKYRHPGSIGATTPQRVIKGLKMAGRMGAERVTVKNLEVIEVDPDKNLLLVKGAVPGTRKAVVEIRSAALTNLGRIRQTIKVKQPMTIR